MPCFDNRNEIELEKFREKQPDVLKLEATLCFIFRKHGLEIATTAEGFEEISGVSKEFVEQWWKEHQERDANKEALDDFLNKRVNKK